MDGDGVDVCRRVVVAGIKQPKEEVNVLLYRHGLTILALLLAGIFLFLVQWRVVTYVCGNDPMLYIRAARVLLQPELYGAEAVRHAMTFVAPGYPVFLAGVIKLFGDLAPYWSNMVVLMAALPLMWFVFRKLMGSERAAAFSILALLLIIFSGHPLHAPFLLYPFREVPRMFLVYLAYGFLLVGMVPKGNRRLLILAASFSLLAACAIREPSVLVLPGMLLGMAGLASSWKGRCHAWAWFLVPWLLGAAVAGFIVSQYALADFSQFSVLHYLGNHDVALARIKQMLAWFPERASWIGLILMVLGIARATRSSWVLLAWFFVPGMLFFVFYAYMHMHDRYFLTTLLFLAVFAGYGLDGVCRGVEHVLSRLFPYFGWPRHVSPLLTGAVLLMFAVGLAWTSQEMSAWGPKMRASQVRSWQALVSSLEPSPDGRIRIAVEQRARYLEDMLLSYTDADLLDPKRIDQWPGDWEVAHYFWPLNRQALWATPQWLMYLEVFAHRLMEHRMNLELVGGVETVIHRIGGGEYAPHRLSPWRIGPHKQLLDVVLREDHVIWLDWGASDPILDKEIVLREPDTDKELLRLNAEGNGLQALFLPAEIVSATPIKLEVHAPGPLPARPVIAAIQATEAQIFFLGSDRRLSTNLLFPEMSPRNTEPGFQMLSLRGSLAFKAPRLLSTVPVLLEVVPQGRFNDLCPGVFLRGIDNIGAGFVRDFCGVNSLRFFVDSEMVHSLRLVAAHAPFSCQDAAFEGVGFRVHVKE